MTGWRWVSPESIIAYNNRYVGLGVRDEGLIMSAMARPQNLEAYGNPDVADLAACYAAGLAQNHGFVDGNKRAAWMVARSFLRKNKIVLNYSPNDASDWQAAIELMVNLANHTITESDVAAWFRARI